VWFGANMLWYFDNLELRKNHVHARYRHLLKMLISTAVEFLQSARAAIGALKHLHFLFKIFDLLYLILHIYRILLIIITE
jgi:hypothetical protein